MRTSGRRRALDYEMASRLQPHCARDNLVQLRGRSRCRRLRQEPNLSGRLQQQDQALRYRQRSAVKPASAACESQIRAGHLGIDAQGRKRWAAASTGVAVMVERIFADDSLVRLGDCHKLQALSKSIERA